MGSAFDAGFDQATDPRGHSQKRSLAGVTNKSVIPKNKNAILLTTTLTTSENELDILCNIHQESSNITQNYCYKCPFNLSASWFCVFSSSSLHKIHKFLRILCIIAIFKKNITQIEAKKRNTEV